MPYRSASVYRRLNSGAPNRVAALCGIYAIINEGERDPVKLARAVLSGGVGIVQYRAKGGLVHAHARAMRQLAGAAGALFIVNDDVEAALRLEADGVHVGPEDAAWKELPSVREQLGDKLLGLSCGSVAEAEFARKRGADYVGVGSCFATLSKPDAGPPIGLDGLRAVVTATSLPVAAIGGITARNITQVAACGAAMAAAISALSGDDAQTAARELVRLWNLP